MTPRSMRATHIGAFTMRALALDPAEQTITETEVHCDAFVIAKLFP
jgi:hypothetical protein